MTAAAAFDPRTFSFDAVLKGTAPRPPISVLLGWDFVARDDAAGVLTLRLPPRPEFGNPVGFIHGGIVTAMMDECMSGAMNLQLPDDLVLPTIDLTVRFIRPALMVPHTGIGRVLNRGQRVGHMSGELLDPDGRLVASASASCMILPRPKAA